MLYAIGFGLCSFGCIMLGAFALGMAHGFGGARLFTARVSVEALGIHALVAEGRALHPRTLEVAMVCGLLPSTWRSAVCARKARHLISAVRHGTTPLRAYMKGATLIVPLSVSAELVVKASGIVEQVSVFIF